MALETYIENREKKGESTVRINLKQKRLTIHKAIEEDMSKSFGPFNYVLFRFDPEVKNSFWLAPCSPDESGAKQINTYIKSKTVALSKGLMAKLNLKNILENTDSKRFPGNWDSRNKAIKIDIL